MHHHVTNVTTTEQDLLMDADWHSVCASATLTEGKAEHFLIGAVDVLVVRIAGVVRAVSNICTHADACLHEGRIRGNRIICPLHGASFDARTGAVLAKPAITSLQCFEVKEAQGNVLVHLPTTGGSPL